MAKANNIKKAQAVWRSMTPRRRALAQPEGRARKKPGVGGGGRYYRIVVRPKEDFIFFRYHDIGRPGHSVRLAGRRSSGRWDTQAYLISKQDVRVEEGKLVSSDPGIKKILRSLGSRVHHIKGDVYGAKPRRNVPENKKPTLAQRRAQVENIRKAQLARELT